MNLKLILFLLLSLLILAGCDDDDGAKNPVKIEWKALGLDGKTVNQMQLHNNNLYIATNSGLYKYKVGAAAGSFKLLGFDAKDVQAVEVIDDKHLIASLYDKLGNKAPAFYITEDAGDTWSPAPQFGGNAPEPVLDFAIRPDNPDIWYAAGLGVIAKSEDAGQTWEPIWGSWGAVATGVSVVTVNPNGDNEIWAGGQGAIENGYLLRSDNETVWDLWDDLADNPSTVKEITFGEKGPNHVLVGFEGALVETEDGGTTWNTLIDSEQHKFFFGICTSKSNANTFYVGGWLKTADPQPLVLHITTDGGQTFKDEGYASEPYGGIWDMVIINDAASRKDILYLGLDKGGIYEVTIPTDALAK